MVKNQSDKEKELLQENEELRMLLAEAEETLNAIHNGEVDAIVIKGGDTEKIFSLTSSETPYRLLVEEMKEGAVTVSEDGTILYCNQSFEDLVSIPMEQIVGSNFKRFIHKDDRHIYNQILSHTSKRVKEEIVYYPCTEEPKYLHLSFCPIPAGVLGKICIIISDITELKKYEHDLQKLVEERTQNLEQINKQLKETNATKDKLFSIIAHDLKGPFTALLGFSELLQSNARKYDIGQFEMMVNHIHSAAKNAYTLLENLLLWAMSKNKQLKFNPEVLDLTSVLKDIVRGLKTIAVMKNITLNYITSEKLITCVDVNMFNAILRNLITNAIKFTYPGGIIEINAKSNENQVEITVADNGIGMSEETKNSLLIIEDNKTTEGTDHEKGTGLGLLICNEFVKKHGGELIIESQLGYGSSFTVVFPKQSMAYNEIDSVDSLNK